MRREHDGPGPYIFPPLWVFRELNMPHSGSANLERPPVLYRCLPRAREVCPIPPDRDHVVTDGQTYLGSRDADARTCGTRLGTDYARICFWVGVATLATGALAFSRQDKPVSSGYEPSRPAAVADMPRSGDVVAAARCPISDCLAIATNDKKLLILSAEGKPIRTFDLAGVPSSLLFSYDGTQLLVKGEQYLALDLLKGTVTATIQRDARDLDAAWGPSATQLVIVTGSERVDAIDLSTFRRQPLFSLPWSRYPGNTNIPRTGFLADRVHCAGVNLCCIVGNHYDNSEARVGVALCDLSIGKVKWSWRGPLSSSLDSVTTLDGTAVGLLDGYRRAHIVVPSLSFHRELHRDFASYGTFASLCFSANGKELLALVENGSEVVVWETISGEKRYSLKLTENPLSAIVAYRKGKLIGVSREKRLVFMAIDEEMWRPSGSRDPPPKLSVGEFLKLPADRFVELRGHWVSNGKSAALAEELLFPRTGPERVSALIQDLAASHFRVRANAQQELRQMPLLAIKELRQANGGASAEVRSTARTLIESMVVPSHDDAVMYWRLMELIEASDRDGSRKLLQRVAEIDSELYVSKLARDSLARTRDVVGGGKER